MSELVDKEGYIFAEGYADAGRPTRWIKQQYDLRRIDHAPFPDDPVKVLIGVPNRCQVCKGHGELFWIETINVKQTLPVHDEEVDVSPGDGAKLQGSSQRCACNVRDFVAEREHNSSSSVGGDAAQAALVGCASEPTEEAPVSEGIDDNLQRVLAPLFSSIGEALMPVARALGEGIAASVVKAGRVSVAPLESSGQGVA